MHFKFFGLHASQYETAGIGMSKLSTKLNPCVYSSESNAFRSVLEIFIMLLFSCTSYFCCTCLIITQIQKRFASSSIKTSQIWEILGKIDQGRPYAWYSGYDNATRGTPRVQFANMRKMVLCQGLPRCLCLCVDPCMARHAQSLNSSLHAWPQNLEAF